MATAKFTLEPNRPPRLTAEERAAQEALTDAEITAAAEADPDNPPLTAGELERVAVARRVQGVRAALGLTQEAFAARYGIPVATLRQWELGRRVPDRTSLAYLHVIAAIPEEVAKALRAA